MNHKNERIKKLTAQGMTPEQIVKKLGLSGPAGLDRVKQGIAWNKEHE